MPFTLSTTPFLFLPPSVDGHFSEKIVDKQMSRMSPDAVCIDFEHKSYFQVLNSDWGVLKLKYLFKKEKETEIFYVTKLLEKEDTESSYDIRYTCHNFFSLFYEFLVKRKLSILRDCILETDSWIDWPKCCGNNKNINKVWN